MTEEYLTLTDNTGALKGKTIFITGASRGIGRAIALKCAADGANIVIAAKSAEPHPKLPGTIYSVASEVEAAGGRALALQVDVRDEQRVAEAMAQAAEQFGGIDAVVNNAGAINLTNVESTPPKRYDLMQSINSRAVYLTAHLAMPYLKQSANGHILSLSPPLNLQPKWLGPFAPYALSKFGMTILSMGLAEELREAGISVTTLWPRTLVATAAIEFAVGNREMFEQSRKPAVMADAAYEILITENGALTGSQLIDEELLGERGVTDLTDYAHNPAMADQLAVDLFLEP
ncbi:citronellol/citronellal dehydrogenase [Microbulbifer donghaiensis]|uniref:Citronellol/citronellal dehydrogenase n=1 Tax=Microbulbifer donghaiensis TaxID=494016 RepID=A0A1M4ZVA9_9GAMM|nr:NAD(P)-dependent oxidoreductase [Microbulbifer donghaiensis]SHF21993.1 citronellol/citronellal dehydrogenase [Microbulbifer donghaiensis]